MPMVAAPMKTLEELQAEVLKISRDLPSAIYVWDLFGFKDCLLDRGVFPLLADPPPTFNGIPVKVDPALGAGFIEMRTADGRVVFRDRFPLD